VGFLTVEHKKLVFGQERMLYGNPGKMLQKHVLHVHALVETAFMINAAYVGSFGNYLQVSIAESKIELSTSSTVKSVGPVT
jgi:hypothetical protein